MGTFLTDKCAEIRKWLAVGSDVYPDETVTSWIRMAEEYLSNGLRVKHMVQIDTLSVIQERTPLPLDWQEIRMTRLLPNGKASRYMTPDAFFNPEWPDDPEVPGQVSRYTVLGNFVYYGGASLTTAVNVELAYYQNIPPLTNDANNWANVYAPTVYTLKILHIASMYAIEDERGPTWDTEVTRLVNAMNAQHKIDMASGSVLMPVRRKTFG